MQYSVRIEEQLVELNIDGPDGDGHCRLSIGEQAPRNVQCQPAGPHQLRLIENALATELFAVRCAQGTWVWARGRARLVQDGSARRTRSGDGDTGPLTVTPAMPAVVSEVLVAVGDEVSKNQALVVVSAMKMEMTLTAPHDGTVSAVNTERGAKVSPGDILVEVEPPSSEDA